MPEATINILMTGGGAPGAAGIIKCLRQESTFRIIVADAIEEVVGKHLGDQFEKIPKATAPDFIDVVLSICKKNDVQIILPLVTKELLPFAVRKNEFEEHGIKVLVSTQSSLDIANDKGKLYEFLQWRGIAVPAFKIIENVDQFKNAVIELGYPQKQLCFKPCVANGSRGFRVLTEKINDLDLLLNYKPDSTFINLKNAIAILSSGEFQQIIVAEYLPGDEYSVDCLAKYGESIIVVPRLRKKMINGISVEGEIVKETEIINYCQQIIKELQLHGNIGIQVKKSETGDFLILEINPRVQGTISAVLGADVNLPVLAVKQELNLPVSPEELKVKWGTKFTRHWSEVFY